MAVSSVFKKTTNLIRLFHYTRGVDEVPPQFYLWAFLTTIAACARDRISVPNLADYPIYPNLYTLLVGPPGCGKGTAINAILPLVRDIKGVNVYAGALNGPTMTKLLHKIKDKLGDSGEKIGSKIFLVMEELAMDVGGTQEAAQFVKYLVGLWKPKPGIFEKTTISSNRYELRDTCINLLGGTTKHWAFEALTMKDLQAGGGRRFIMVQGHVDPKNRVTHVHLPPDREKVLEHIAAHLRVISEMKGEMRKTDGALAWEDWWYNNRPDYAGEDDIPQWKQLPELMNQIAMILVLADGFELVMKQGHLMMGLQLAEEAQRGLTAIAEYGRTMDSGLIQEAFRIVRDNPGITWDQWIIKSGLMSSRLQGIANTLIQSGRVFIFKGTDKRTRYSTNELYDTVNKSVAFDQPDPTPPSAVIEEDYGMPKGYTGVTEPEPD